MLIYVNLFNLLNYVNSINSINLDKDNHNYLIMLIYLIAINLY